MGKGKQIMVRLLIVAWAILAIAIAVAAWLVPDVDVKGGIVGLLVTAAVFGLVNVVVGPVLRLLTLPITLMTLGLFSLVVNGILLAVAAGLTSYLDVGGLVQTTVAALLITLLSALAHFLVIQRLGTGQGSQTTAV